MTNFEVSTPEPQLHFEPIVDNTLLSPLEIVHHCPLQTILLQVSKWRMSSVNMEISQMGNMLDFAEGCTLTLFDFASWPLIVASPQSSALVAAFYAPF